MLRVPCLLAAGLICSSCASLFNVSTSRTIPAPLDLACIVEALRVQPSVRQAGVSGLGTVSAELIMPDGLEHPTPHPRVDVEMWRDDGATEIRFVVDSIGWGANPEYRIHLENVIEELCDQTIATCGAK
jgi:hypothetical protein